MSSAMLIDTTLCIGCRACQASCKSWNNLPGIRTTFTASGTNPTCLGSKDYTRVIFREAASKGGGVDLHFVKRQCMHCLQPGCVAACRYGALQRLDSGPVVLDETRCTGCRECAAACPFMIPKFQWGTTSIMHKCTFCADRQAAGLQPACSATCPTQALSFGERSRLLEEGKRRIQARPGRYVGSIYGETLVGGTSHLYLIAVPFEALGLHKEGFRTDLGDTPQGKQAALPLPGLSSATLTLGGLCLGLGMLRDRRARVQAEKRE